MIEGLGVELGTPAHFAERHVLFAARRVGVGEIGNTLEKFDRLGVDLGRSGIFRIVDLFEFAPC